MQHPSASYLGRLLLRRPLSAHLTDTSVTICPPGRAGVPALPLIGAKTATGRLACSKKTSLQIQVKRNGFLSGFRTCCLGMACLFGLLNGILSVSLKSLVAALGLFSGRCDFDRQTESRYVRAGDCKPRGRWRHTVEA